MENLTGLLSGLLSGAVGSTAALQQEGSGFDSWPGVSPGTPVSSKNMTVRLIGFSKLSLGVSVCMNGC